MSKSISKNFPYNVSNNISQQKAFVKINNLSRFGLSQEELLHSYVLNILNE